MENEDDLSTSMNVSLPRTLRSYVDERVSASAYSSASEYVRELIRKDREQRVAHDRLERLLLDGYSAGAATEKTEADWAALRARVTQRLASKRPEAEKPLE